ncbi:hypothetical protein STRAU_5522 [Streptomyces aurantiacus JA 4570]|uniref:Uncharacterized protein n=1 Tax=Streptomyces aurantiacus JA 4570 TaxID=1286094 RepID=S3ZFI1_9ACTN|nr:hypothetical protein STRAU_5522 [Streptomyces aurantiacus JA 4570]
MCPAPRRVIRPAHRARIRPLHRSPFGSVFAAPALSGGSLFSG